MKTNILVTSLFLLAGLISSCQSEIDETKGYGYLQLSAVDINKSVTTRADITESEAIAVDILDESNTVVQHADDWRNLDDVLLRVATYTIKHTQPIRLWKLKGLMHCHIMKDKAVCLLRLIRQKV